MAHGRWHQPNTSSKNVKRRPLANAPRQAREIVTVKTNARAATQRRRFKNWEARPDLHDER